MMNFDVTKSQANISLLNIKLQSYGLSIHKLSQYMSVPYNTLRDKFNGKGHFSVPETVWISYFLHLTPEEFHEIFFRGYMDLYHKLMFQYCTVKTAKGELA